MSQSDNSDNGKPAMPEHPIGIAIMFIFVLNFAWILLLLLMMSAAALV